MLAFEMLSPIAVTEKAEVGTGWGRGGEGVTTGWERVGRRLGRRASITFGYHRRPPARTRAGPGAGARIEGLPPMPPTPESQLYCRATYVNQTPKRMEDVREDIETYFSAADAKQPNTT